MTRPSPDDPVVIDSATGEWLPGNPAPSLIEAGRGHAWQMVEGIWRLAEPEDDEEAVYRAVRVGQGSMLCIGEGCVRTRELPAGVGYVCAEHMDVDKYIAPSIRSTQTASRKPATTVPARSRRKEPDMARSRAATEDLTAKPKGDRRKSKTVLAELDPPTDPNPEKTRLAAKAEPVIDTTTGMRHCIGSARFDIEPHDAPVADFPAQPSQKDGLGRMCATHWKAYVKALNAARKATAALPEVAKSVAPREPVVVQESAPAAPRLQTPEQVEKVAKVRAAKATLAAMETLPGPEYVNAIGTDEAQEALAVAAEASLGRSVEEVDAD